MLGSERNRAWVSLWNPGPFVLISGVSVSYLAWFGSVRLNGDFGFIFYFFSYSSIKVLYKLGYAVLSSTPKSVPTGVKRRATWKRRAPSLSRHWLEGTHSRCLDCGQSQGHHSRTHSLTCNRLVLDLLGADE